MLNNICKVYSATLKYDFQEVSLDCCISDYLASNDKCNWYFKNYRGMAQDPRLNFQRLESFLRLSCRDKIINICS